MKRTSCVLLTCVFLLGVFPANAEEDSLISSARSFFNSTWNSVSNAASNAWNSISNLAVESWHKAGSYISKKGDEFSVWMSITGNDALEKLKDEFDKLSHEMQISEIDANDLWLRAMDYADDNDIAKVTQAKLTLAALLYAQSTPDAKDTIQVALDMLINSGISNQSTAEQLLAETLNATKDTTAMADLNQMGQYIGECVNTGTDNGYSESNSINAKDPHFGWRLGQFYITGYTRTEKDENGNPVFIKTLGDQVELHFQLEQDIDCLNGSDTLSIVEDDNGFDEGFGISKTNFGRGALIIQHTDHRNATDVPQLFTDYLVRVTSNDANTAVQFFEEGDYSVALDYEIKDHSLKILNRYHDYRISFTFSVRNGNCMVYPFDVVTGKELTNSSISENGFYLDLARSRYLDINIKREILTEGADGLTEDIRSNLPAKDGDQYTEDGIYTITVNNRYTGQQTTKRIYVGTNKLLMAHAVTGLPIKDIREQLANGAQIMEDGTIIHAAND